VPGEPPTFTAGAGDEKTDVIADQIEKWEAIEVLAFACFSEVVSGESEKIHTADNTTNATIAKTETRFNMTSLR